MHSSCFFFIVFASLPVSTRATVVTNYVLLSIAEPSAESSIPTSIVLHFWIIACRWWENNYKHIPVHNSDQIFLCSSLQWSHINRLWISYVWSALWFAWFDLTWEENVHVHCLPSPAVNIRRSTRRTKLTPFMSGQKELSDTVVDKLMLYLYSF